jgi:hypothetical protein
MIPLIRAARFVRKPRRDKINGRSASELAPESLSESPNVYLRKNRYLPPSRQFQLSFGTGNVLVKMRQSIWAESLSESPVLSASVPHTCIATEDHATN